MKADELLPLIPTVPLASVASLIGADAPPDPATTSWPTNPTLAGKPLTFSGWGDDEADVIPDVFYMSTGGAYPRLLFVHPGPRPGLGLARGRVHGCDTSVFALAWHSSVMRLLLEVSASPTSGYLLDMSTDGVLFPSCGDGGVQAADQLRQLSSELARDDPSGACAVGDAALAAWGVASWDVIEACAAEADRLLSLRRP